MGKRKAEAQLDADVAEDEAPAPAPVQKAADTTPAWHNKEKVLLLSSRGITHRYVIETAPGGILMTQQTSKVVSA